MNEFKSQLAVETATAVPEFMDLLQLATETCLRSPEKFQQNLEIIRSQNPQIDGAVSRYGLWGVRQAIEPSINLKEISTLPYKGRPDGPYLPPDKNIQDYIEAFGKTLLDDAFYSLGEEAPVMAAKFRDATKTRHKNEALDWLQDRIDQIKSSAPKFFDQEFYHPVRLSPKAIGCYPDIQIDTTCLGYSILEASFFEKAGTPYLHGGVAVTAEAEARRAQTILMENILAVGNEFLPEFPEQIKRRFVSAAVENLREIRRHHGYHAAVLAEIDDGVWYQFDPNFYMDMPIDPAQCGKYDEIYATFTEMKANGIRGIEAMFVNRNGMFPHFFNGGPVDALIETCFLPEDAREFLLNLEPETALTQIAQHGFARLFNPEDNNPEMYVQDLVQTLCRCLRVDYDDYMWDRVGQAIINYVFPDSRGGDIRSCLARLKSDPAYLERRAEDMNLAPFMALLSIQGDLCNSIIADGSNLSIPHSVVELGLPAYRIGASVLSDFAVFCGDDIAPSFWMAHWPSMLSLTEHIPDKTTPTQQEVLRQRAKVIKRNELRYRSVDSIIKTVLNHGGANGADRREAGPDGQADSGATYPEHRHRSDQGVQVA